MRGPRLRTTIKSVVAILCAACFLTMSLGSVSRTIAADTWETWPKKTTVPGVDAEIRKRMRTARSAGSGRGRRRGKETATDAKGRSIRKNSWWIAAGTAVVIGIAIAMAAGGGGGGGGTIDEPRPPMSSGSSPIC